MIQTPAPSNAPEEARPLGQVVSQVKGWVERCGWIWVEGQLTELRRRSGGTQFLTLRDTRADVSASVTCSTMVLDAAGPVVEGMTLVALVHPMLYAKNTKLSFECAELRIAGEGRLLAQLEQLKRKLQAEGLFDPVRKKRLPFLPRAIGLVTGANSAAERDVLTNIERRWAGADVRVRHSLMQGPDCAANVMAELAVLDADPDVDVIIIARGGGSLDDLLPFSDEGLVRAVAAAKTPVISAIGHEPDSPIMDLAANVRASTPTEAAKIVVPDAAEQQDQVATMRNRARAAIISRIRNEQHALDQIRSRPVLRDPVAGFSVHQERIDNLHSRLDVAIDRRLLDESRTIDHQLARVRAMSPKATLERGYAIVADAEGSSVTSVHDVEPGDQLLVYLSDGQLYAEVDYQGEDE